MRCVPIIGVHVAHKVKYPFLSEQAKRKGQGGKNEERVAHVHKDERTLPSCHTVSAITKAVLQLYEMRRAPNAAAQMVQPWSQRAHTP